MKTKKRSLWLLGIGIAAIAIVLLTIGGRGKAVARLTQAACTEGTVERTVTATGEIQPVYKVEVGTQVSGIVEKMYVDYNSTVSKGQLLAELDKSLLQEQVKQAEANLSTTTSNRNLAQKNYDRVKRLYEQKAATQEEYDQAETSLEQARNQLITAQSDYDRARTNLKYAEIYSPIDGVILSKAVEQGQTVASSFSTPTLFTIAANLTDMQLEAKVDEADIGRVHEGQKVRFAVDAFPDNTFYGIVRQIRLVPTVVSNVVTYTVIIDAPNHDGKLYPGMTANITIVVESQSGPTIPLEAVRLTIDSTTERQLKKQGYTVGRQLLPATASAVWKVDGKKVTQQEVTLGTSDGATVVIDKGLAAGDEVVLGISLTKERRGGAGVSVQMGPPK